MAEGGEVVSASRAVLGPVSNRTTVSVTMQQQFIPGLTPWHITFGTYGTRTHGGFRATVDKSHNKRGEAFIEQSGARETSAVDRMKFAPRRLTNEQQRFIESAIPDICTRGGWTLRTCSAARDHVHIVLDIEKRVHGETVRRLIKRWLGQELSKRWPLHEGTNWWAEEGSNRAFDSLAYLANAYNYVFEQRATPPSDACANMSSVGAEDGPAR